ncbi:MAG: membrane integrity-associated transporter subunit PqiC [Rhodocyclales bacterium]|nr:membrane integrity-associated transporter subunit PqiC [Rhodocyclales bacterium]
MIRMGLLAAAAVLSACAATPRAVEPQRYDFGVIAAGANSWRLPLAEIEVRAASWLDTEAMHYRLAYAEPLRRQTYVESRWAAPPAELLENMLRRHHARAVEEAAGTGCRLQLVLDELEQRFDSPQVSQVRIELHAVLLPAHGSDMLARRAFRLERPASSADARGGAGAAREVALAAAGDIAAWTNDLARDRPAVVERCRH